MKIAQKIAINGLLLVSTLSYAYAPLPAEQAFQLTIQTTQTDSVIAHWTIAPGYYLYRDRIHFKLTAPANGNLGHITLPPGLPKEDAIFGKYQVYQNQLSIPVPVLNPNSSTTGLQISYQGCAASGFCYPAITKQVQLTAAGVITMQAVDQQKPNIPDVTAYNEQNKVEIFLTERNIGLNLLLFFGFGLLLAFTPCVLPMIPILSSIIVGQGHKLNTARAFGLACTYVCAMSVTFCVAGVVVGLIGSNLQIAMQNPWVIVSFSLIFVLLALSLFGFYELQLPHFLQQRLYTVNQRQRGGNYLGVGIMGSLSSLILSPCITPPLVGALAYIGNTGNALLGGSALFAMGLGMGIPLIAMGTTFGKFLPKAGPWMDTVKKTFGILQLGVAIFLLERILPGPITLLLWALLSILAGICLGALRWFAKSGWERMSQGFGIGLVAYGFLLLIGAGMGHSNPLQPLPLSNQAITAAEGITFKKIKTLAEVQHEITAARAQGKMALLDFYADWCIACKEMAATTFNKPEVKAALTGFILLQVDVTANNANDKSLMRYYNVIGPPTLLFFSPQGQEINVKRIVGGMGPKEFLGHLEGLNPLTLTLSPSTKQLVERGK